MAQLRQARSSRQETLDEFGPGTRVPSAPAITTPAPPLSVSGPMSFDPKPQIPDPPAPVPGTVPGSEQGAGGTGMGPREGSVGAPQSGGAGVRSITTPKVPTPQNGAQVGVAPAPIPPPALPQVSLRSLTTPREPEPFRSPEASFQPSQAPAMRNAELFGGGMTGPLFGKAGGLQGGGLGVPGAVSSVDDSPSALIQTLLKLLGGQ